MHTVCENQFVFLHVSPTCIPIIPCEKVFSRDVLFFSILLYSDMNLKKLLKTVTNAYVACMYVSLLCFFQYV
jgi:hypothetical protein